MGQRTEFYPESDDAFVSIDEEHLLPEDVDGVFPSRFGRKTFMFRHGLADHPLFELSSIVRLAERLEKHDAVFWSNGAVGVSDRWEAGTEGRQPLMATLENIANNNSLVMVRSVVHDQTFGPLMRATLERILDLIGPAIQDDVIGARATLLVASPHRMTAYHIDADLNFLMQIAGKKRFRVHDHTDSTLITTEELERYFSGDANGALYQEDRLGKASLFTLDAGDGVHVPSLSPHWAENGDDVSIAVSFNYDLHSVDRTGRIHKVNRRLRSLGLHPRPPGANRTVDRAKLALYGAYALGDGLLHPGAHTADETLWQPRHR